MKATAKNINMLFKLKAYRETLQEYQELEKPSSSSFLRVKNFISPKDPVGVLLKDLNILQTQLENGDLLADQMDPDDMIDNLMKKLKSDTLNNMIQETRKLIESNRQPEPNMGGRMVGTPTSNNNNNNNNNNIDTKVRDAKMATYLALSDDEFARKIIALIKMFNEDLTPSGDNPLAKLYTAAKELKETQDPNQIIAKLIEIKTGLDNLPNRQKNSIKDFIASFEPRIQAKEAELTASKPAPKPN